MNFDNLFRNQFDTKEISDEHLGKYTLELLPRVSGYARFAALVTPLLQAYQDYFGATSTEATKLAIQTSLTVAAERALGDFRTLVSRHEGAARSEFGEGTPEYLRLYPHGLTEYTSATVGALPEKLKRYEDALNDAAVGGRLLPKVKADFLNNGADGKPKGVIVRYREARQAQLDAKGVTSTSKTAAHTSRDALEIQLQVVLLAVALDAAPRPAAERTELRRIFPQYLLEGRTPTPEETAPTPTPATPK
jgi:hypothetical protein